MLPLVAFFFYFSLVEHSESISTHLQKKEKRSKWRNRENILNERRIKYIPSLLLSTFHSSFSYHLTRHYLFCYIYINTFFYSAEIQYFSIWLIGAISLQKKSGILSLKSHLGLEKICSILILKLRFVNHLISVAQCFSAIPSSHFSDDVLSETRVSLIGMSKKFVRTWWKVS